MKKHNDEQDLRDEELGCLLRAAFGHQTAAQIPEYSAGAEFAGVYRKAEAEENRKKKASTAFKIIPSVLAACLVLMLAPKGNPAAALPDFRAAVSILSSESVMDETWTAESLRGENSGRADENISSFVQNLWNQNDIGFD